MMFSPIIYAQLFRSNLSLSGSSIAFPDFSISLSVASFYSIFGLFYFLLLIPDVLKGVWI